MLNMMNKVIKKISFIPFVLGFIGYFYIGNLDFGNAIYATILIYFLNPVSEVDNFFVLVAKLLGVFVTTGFIIGEFSRFSNRLKFWTTKFFSDATVIYTDMDLGKTVSKIFRHGFIVDTKEGKVLSQANCHFIFLNKDIDSIRFFEENRTDLKNKKVYLLFHELDSFLPEIGEIEVHAVNINDLLARSYWRTYHLYEKLKEERKMKIAIIGNGDVAGTIFKYAYLNNLYFLDQEIEYHLWGVKAQEIALFRDLPVENRDAIIIHEENFLISLKSIAEMSRVILAGDWELEIIQNLLLYNVDLEIHFYSDKKINLANFFGGKNVLSFGEINERFTEDSIKREQIYRGGKLFNYDYILRSKEQKMCEIRNPEMEIERAWSQLSAFKKSASVARADHYHIELMIKRDYPQLEEAYLWEMEHIRWSRFHYLNHWHYGEKRSDSRKEHPYLIPFNLLPYEEQAKDGIYDKDIEKELESISI